MLIDIHPSAISNFNDKAEELTGLIEEFQEGKAKKGSFPSDIHIAASITAKDIIGDIEMVDTDHRGKIISRFFLFNGKKFGLNKDNYGKLIDVAERLQSKAEIRNKLSRTFVEKTLFSWVTKKYQKEDVHNLFIDYLEDNAQSVVKKITSWIPIANLEVQCAFPVSNSEIRPLSKALIDKWESRSKVGQLSNEDKEYNAKKFERIRKSNQGLASIVTTIEAEPDYVSDFSLEEAQKITAILGIFSEATLLPNIKCVSNIKGSEHIEKSTIFFENDENGLTMSSGVIDSFSVKHWILGQEEISEIRRNGLDKISALLASKSLTEFEKSVLNSIFLYSKSAFTADPVEKVVYMLSSLESILLKNENEPIQQNLAERIAVFTAKKLDDRKSIIKIVKSVYGVRSKYLHHGHSSSELKLITDFMVHVWVFFMHLLKNVDRFKTRLDFVSVIDDLKLG